MSLVAKKGIMNDDSKSDPNVNEGIRNVHKVNKGATGLNNNKPSDEDGGRDNKSSEDEAAVDESSSRYAMDQEGVEEDDGVEEDEGDEEEEQDEDEEGVENQDEERIADDDEMLDGWKRFAEKSPKK